MSMTFSLIQEVRRSSRNRILQGFLSGFSALGLFYLVNFFVRSSGDLLIGVLLLDTFFLFVFIAGIFEIYYYTRCFLQPQKHDIYKTMAQYRVSRNIQLKIKKEAVNGGLSTPNIRLTEH
jgi:hypothetical protein